MMTPVMVYYFYIGTNSVRQGFRQHRCKITLCHTALFFIGTQRLETCRCILNFIVAQNHCIPSATFVCFFHLAFEAATATMTDYNPAIELIAQGFCQRHRRCYCCITHSSYIHICIAVCLFGYKPQGIQQQNETFQPHGETDSSRRLAAKLLYQAIVPTACTDSSLGTKALGNPLKNSFPVIIEPTNQGWINGVGDASSIQ